MIVIACVDHNMGMMFNKRRQSRDKAVIEKIYAIVGEHKLFISEFSSGLFDEKKVCVGSEMLNKAAGGDYCFVENMSLKEFENKIEGVILFKWNRVYPADFRLDIPLDGYRKISASDFPGSSHDIITQEVYVK